jgi:hypothetical protein
VGECRRAPDGMVRSLPLGLGGIVRQGVAALGGRRRSYLLPEVSVLGVLRPRAGRPSMHPPWVAIRKWNVQRGGVGWAGRGPACGVHDDGERMLERHGSLDDDGGGGGGGVLAGERLAGPAVGLRGNGWRAARTRPGSWLAVVAVH